MHCLQLAHLAREKQQVASHSQALSADGELIRDLLSVA